MHVCETHTAAGVLDSAAKAFINSTYVTIAFAVEATPEPRTAAGVLDSAAKAAGKPSTETARRILESLDNMARVG